MRIGLFVFAAILAAMISEEVVALDMAPTNSNAPFIFDRDKQEIIEINNRVLTKVGGKAITVMDVVKKMDVIFYREFAEYKDLTSARYQFYVATWKQVLKDLIDKELILADAAEMKMEVSNGDVRQEMEEMFGPNIVATLDGLEINHDEAWEMTRTDIILRRMMYARVNVKALGKVHPCDIRTAYGEFSVQQSTSDEWVYQVVSIRDPDGNKGAEAAQRAYTFLIEKGCSLDTLVTTMTDEGLIDASTSVKVAEESRNTEETLSPAYREILAGLDPGTYSEPIAQTSRASNSTVHRIFFLKEKMSTSIPSLKKIEQNLRNQLLEQAMAEETNAYLDSLHQHFAVNEETLLELIPDDFEPFTIN